MEKLTARTAEKITWELNIISAISTTNDVHISHATKLARENGMALQKPPKISNATQQKSINKQQTPTNHPTAET